MPRPALLTRMSTGPNAETAPSMIVATASWSARSAGTATAEPPADVQDATISSRSSLRRATATTRAPRRARATAVEAPIPDDAPVTTATLSRMSTSVGHAGAKRCDRGLLARSYCERVEVEAVHGVEVRDFVDLLVGDLDPVEVLPQRFRRRRPRRVGVRVVALPRDVVDADEVTLEHAGLVVDEAEREDLTRLRARQHVAELLTRPETVPLVDIIDSFEEVRHPPDA